MPGSDGQARRAPSSLMLRLVTLLGLLAGAALAVALVASHGVAAVWHAAARLGWGGFALVVACHLLLIGQMGSAWWLLGRVTGALAGALAGSRRLGFAAFAIGRLIRESASEVLPLSQVGGFVVGARALALAGASGAFAAASTVVDVSVELVAQLIYTLIGLVLLDWLRPGNAVGTPIVMGLLLMMAGAGLFVAVQARGAGLVERLARRMAPQLLGGPVGHDPAVQVSIHALHRRPDLLGAAALIHLGSWLLSGVEMWVTLRLMGVAIGLGPALAIDSLVYGMRSAAFLVPNAMGVQEGGLILLAGLFGVGADTALALSLIKRARDVTIGAPALLVWQAVEARLAWRRSGQRDRLDLGVDGIADMEAEPVPGLARHSRD